MGKVQGSKGKGKDKDKKGMTGGRSSGGARTHPRRPVLPALAEIKDSPMREPRPKPTRKLRDREARILCRHIRDNARWGNCPLGGEACPYSHKPEKFGLSSALRHPQSGPKAEPKLKARKRGTRSGQDTAGGDWEAPVGLQTGQGGGWLLVGPVGAAQEPAIRGAPPIDKGLKRLADLPEK